VKISSAASAAVAGPATIKKPVSASQARGRRLRFIPPAVIAKRPGSSTFVAAVLPDGPGCVKPRTRLRGAVIATTYKDAGVDIAAGDALVGDLRPLAAATARPGVTGDLGGFGALFDLAALDYQDPILVAATDGVGTKLRLAIDSGRHDAIGVDLVAMCVNDLVVQGAEPLFFLDYYATAQLEPAVARAVIAGIAEGCRRAGCALIGGETAEMPGLYRAGDYDLAGFAVGAVERAGLLPRGVAAGDVVLGLAADGVHANGFSLVRRLLERAGLSLDDPAPFAPGASAAEALLAPTRIYVTACRAAIAAGGVRALAHITGGGLPGNLPRVVPDGLVAELDAVWPAHPVFGWLAEVGNVAPDEMLRTFNCGVGMVLIVAPERAEAIVEVLDAAGETVSRIGIIAAGDGPAVTVASARRALGR